MAGLLSLWHLHHRPSYQHIIHKFMLWNIQFRHPYNQDNTSYSFLLLLQPLLKVFVKWQSHDRASKVPWSQSPFSSATSTHSQKESCQARELLKETDDYKVLQAFTTGRAVCGERENKSQTARDVNDFESCGWFKALRAKFENTSLKGDLTTSIC